MTGPGVAHARDQLPVWNLNRQPLAPRVGRLVQTYAPDVVILAECVTQPGHVTRVLNSVGAGTFRLVPGSGDELRLFTRRPVGEWSLLLREQLDAWLVFRMAIPVVPELLLFAAHLPSKLHTDEQDRLLDASLLGADIRRMEQQVGHARSVLVGDLNSNPFEAPVVWAGGIHGVMTRDIARREAREVRGREYPILYNPMWSVFGDRNRTAGPSGTYYRSSSQSVNYFWNTFDQVLLRPEVMDHLTELRILDSDGQQTLLTPSGLPDAANGSDHLPLFFRLDW